MEASGWRKEAGWVRRIKEDDVHNSTGANSPVCCVESLLLIMLAHQQRSLELLLLILYWSWLAQYLSAEVRGTE